MPGVTSLGIHYPYMSEGVSDVSCKTLADDVDGLLVALAAKRTAALHKLTARIRLTTPLNVVAATPTNIVFQVEDWDTDALANLGVNNERLTIDNGFWWVTGSISGGGVGTLTSHRAMLTLNGTVVYAHKTDQTSSTSAVTTTSGLVLNSAGPSPLRLQSVWTGAGGPLSVSGASLTAIRIRSL